MTDRKSGDKTPLFSDKGKNMEPKDCEYGNIISKKESFEAQYSMEFI